MNGKARQSDQDQECGYRSTKRAIPGHLRASRQRRPAFSKAFRLGSQRDGAIGQIEAIIGFHQVPVARRPDFARSSSTRLQGTEAAPSYPIRHRIAERMKVCSPT
jgi:hypothetical protein